MISITNFVIGLILVLFVVHLLHSVLRVGAYNYNSGKYVGTLFSGLLFVYIIPFMIVSFGNILNWFDYSISVHTVMILILATINTYYELKMRQEKKEKKQLHEELMAKNTE